MTWRWVTRRRDAAGRLVCTPIPFAPAPPRPGWPDKAAAWAARCAGASWAEIAARYGYKDAGSACTSVWHWRRRHSPEA